MALSRFVTIVLLTLLGFVLILLLIKYFYSRSLNAYMKLSNKTDIQSVMDSVLLLQVLLKTNNSKKKRSSISGELLFLIVALVIVLVIAIYYEIVYKGAIKTANVTSSLIP